MYNGVSAHRDEGPKTLGGAHEIYAPLGSILARDGAVLFIGHAQAHCALSITAWMLHVPTRSLHLAAISIYGCGEGIIIPATLGLGGQQFPLLQPMETFGAGTLKNIQIPLHCP